MLISGSSGAAKSRFVFGLIDEWYRLAMVLGHKAKANPVLRYYAYDRSLDDIHDLLNDMSHWFPKLYIASMWGVTTDFPPVSELEGIDALIIDGIDFMVDDMSNPSQVRGRLTGAGRLLRNLNCSMIAITGSAKLRAGEAKYSNVRERSMGSAYWGRSTGSNVDISYDPEDEQLIRHVAVQPYCGGPAEHSEWTFNHQNRLTRQMETRNERENREFFLYALPASPANFTTAEAEIVGEKLQLSRATIHRYLKYLSLPVVGPLITKTGRGKWSKTSVQ